MKYWLAGLIVWNAALPVHAEEPTLQQARQRWLRGNYEEARAQYETLTRDGKLKVPATIGLSRTWESQGAYDKALAVVEAALRESPDDANLHARRAEVLLVRGRWDDALQAAENALTLKEDHFPARWVRAQVLRNRGDMEAGEVEVRCVVRTSTNKSEKTHDIKAPDI